jgi:hypothetical protein
VCTLAVKKKSRQVSTCRIGPFPCKSLIGAEYIERQRVRVRVPRRPVDWASVSFLSAFVHRKPGSGAA